MTRQPDPGQLLRRALEANADAAAVEIAITGQHARDWASATFSGARHRLVMAARASAALDRWLAELPDADFTLRGHLVAEVAIVERTPHDGDELVIVEALTVVDG